MVKKKMSAAARFHYCMQTFERESINVSFSDRFDSFHSKPHSFRVKETNLGIHPINKGNRLPLQPAQRISNWTFGRCRNSVDRLIGRADSQSNRSLTNRHYLLFPMGVSVFPSNILKLGFRASPFCRGEQRLFKVSRRSLPS